MSKRPRSRRTDLAVYAAVRGVVAFLQAVPAPVAEAFAALLATLAYRIDKRHRLVAAENLRAAFPEWAHSPGRVEGVVRGCYRHFARMIVEIALLPRKLHTINWRDHATLVGERDLVGVLLSGRPTLIVTGHFGNWELAGFVLGRLGFRTFAIARVLDNAYLEAYLKRFRQATGQTIIAKKDDFARLTSVMSGGGKVATLADQDAGPRGVFVPFFRRPASAHKAVALMALEYDAELIVVGVPRVGGLLEYEVVCEDRFDARVYADRPDAVRAITARYHAALERLVRRHPEQYFWLHRRWKTPPRKGPALPPPPSEAEGGGDKAGRR